MLRNGELQRMHEKTFHWPDTGLNFHMRKYSLPDDVHVCENLVVTLSV